MRPPPIQFQLAWRQDFRIALHDAPLDLPDVGTQQLAEPGQRSLVTSPKARSLDAVLVVRRGLEISVGLTDDGGEQVELRISGCGRGDGCLSMRYSHGNLSSATTGVGPGA
jgi:hypothetical protein